MADIILTRYLNDADFGTFGYMYLDGMKVWTVERPWQNNQKFISCIPGGTYTCKPRRYNRGGYDAIEITNVPDRSHILFHKANLAEQLAGCIAPGMYRGCLNNKWAILNSKRAFGLLMAECGQRDFILEIRQGFT